MGRNNKRPSDVKRNKHNLRSDNPEFKECLDQLLKLTTSAPQPTTLKALDHHIEISKVLDKIKSIEHNQSQVENTDNEIRNSPEKLQSFSQWLKKNGAVFVGSSIAEFPGYDLGLKADMDIPYGSLFIAVPRKLMMTVDGAKKSILKKYIEKDQLLKQMHNITLVMYLFVEKFKENSFYKPYIDLLPKTYSTVLYFSNEELNELKGSPTLEIALKQIRNTARQYAYFQTMFANNDDMVSRILRENFTYEEYR